MPIPAATATDYLWQFQRLLPRGRVWQRAWGTLQAQYLLTLMPTWARLHARAGEVIGETFPCTVSVEMLPEWEATLGLPDCAPLDTVQQRQAAVCAKFAMRGGQSMGYYLKLAADNGFDIDIETYSAFRVDINTAEQPLYDSTWDYAWTVVSSEDSYVYFRADQSTVEEPLEAWGNAQLQCLIEKYAPAHTIPMFEYRYTVSIWDGGDSIWDGGASIWDQWAP